MDDIELLKWAIKQVGTQDRFAKWLEVPKTVGPIPHQTTVSSWVTGATPTPAHVLRTIKRRKHELRLMELKRSGNVGDAVILKKDLIPLLEGICGAASRVRKAGIDGMIEPAGRWLRKQPVAAPLAKMPSALLNARR